MNLMYLKYAVEVARLGSINKAAEQLFVAQPNLSRYIKNLETELGIVIFKRTSRGMTLTPDGETFVRYAAQVLNQIDDIERMYKGIHPEAYEEPGRGAMRDVYAAMGEKIAARRADACLVLSETLM